MSFLCVCCFLLAYFVLCALFSILSGCCFVSIISRLFSHYLYYIVVLAVVRTSMSFSVFDSA